MGVIAAAAALVMEFPLAEEVEAAPVFAGGTGYLRVAAAPYNTPGDYCRLADAVLDALGGR